jgi:hypothetical protein
MADYRDLAAALGGGYGQDTGGITPDTLITLKGGKKATASDLLGMIKEIGAGSLSNLESLIRGGVAQVPGAGGDIEGLARMGINKAFGAGGVNVSPTPVLPTTTDILGMMPRKTAARPESAGMEELGGYMSPAFGKIAKPAVTGYAKLAGQEINAAMTGQPTRSLLGDITPKPKLLDVYHGTPHTLPPTERNPLGEFDASKIGTGEGAQAYGYGIYTAEAPAVANEYKKALSNPEVVLPNGTRITNPVAGSGEDVAKAWLEEAYLNKDKNPFETAIQKISKLRNSANSPAQFDEAVNVLKNWQNQGAKVDLGGNLYKIDLPDEKIATMIDWDKPLSQQSLQVQKALKGIEKDLPTIPNFDLKKWMDADPLASTWHNAIVRDLKVEPAKISELLQNKGVAGIKYLDELSRRPGVASMTQAQIDARISSLKKDIGSGLGNQERMKQQLASLEQERASHPKLTHNFVVFPGEEKSMTILERNAEKNAK